MYEDFELVPQTMRANIEWRLKARKAAEHSRALQAGFMEQCKRDVLFFFSAFCWLTEPRPTRDPETGKAEQQIRPFIPWPHQLPAIKLIDEHLGYDDIGIDKARGEGGSWIAIYFSIHRWLFRPDSVIGWVSRNVEAVDDPKDPGSLMAKMDWALKQFPPWMLPKGWDAKKHRNYSTHNFLNPENGSTIKGYPATGDLAAGGRALFLFMDELGRFPRPQDESAMSASEPVTESRLLVSTYDGDDGAFYKLMHEPNPSLKKIILDWKDNPTRNRGLYKFENGHCVPLDLKNPLPPDYQENNAELFRILKDRGFALEGSIRSPWYDKRCARARMTPQKVAQEYDRNPSGTVVKFFNETFGIVTKETVRPPDWEGQLGVNPVTLAHALDKQADGPFKLWLGLRENPKPVPGHEYVVSADISWGLGGTHTSNSAIQIFDKTEMRQVGEYITGTVPPSGFADMAISLAYWFNKAYLIWETNGPGTAFTQQVLDRHYPNIFFMDVNNLGFKKKSKAPGWTSGAKSRNNAFESFREEVVNKKLTLSSAKLVEECFQYEFRKNKLVHIAALNTDDQSSRGEAHGDRVIAAIVGLVACLDRPATDPERDLTNPPRDTMAYRMKMYNDREAAMLDEWGDGDVKYADW